jgi:hypothetical protein
VLIVLSGGKGTHLFYFCKGFQLLFFEKNQSNFLTH